VIEFGVNQVEIGGGDAWIKEADVRNVLSGIKEIGATWVRFIAAWDFIEKSPGRYDTTALTNLDRAINLCAEYGLSPLLLVSVGQGRGGDGSATAYGNLCRMLATRYGPSGSAQVNAFELWNEPNWSLFMSPVSATVYVEFAAAGAAGIRAVHPTARVISAGVATMGTGNIIIASSVNPLDYLKSAINAGLLNHCDGIGFHWYSQDDHGKWQVPQDGQIAWERLKGVHDYIEDKGGTQKLWLTEIGVAYPAITSLITARDYLLEQIELIAATDWIEAVFYYNYRNTGTDTSNPFHQFGFVNFDFSKKQPLWDFAKTIPTLLGGGAARPPSPTGLVVTGHTTSSVTLMWNSSVVEINAPAAAANASASAPSLVTGVTLAAPAAAATAAARVPAVVSSSTLAAPAATATASAPAPSLSTSSGTTLSAPAATVTASAPVPALTTSSTLAAPAASGTASAPAPVVSASSSLAAPAATATAAAVAPTAGVSYRAHNDADLIVDVDPNTLTGTLVNNDPISTITPTAGSELAALVQGTSSNRPLFKTNAINGLPSILFDGSNDRLAVSSAWSRGYGPGYASDPTPVTCFAVIKGSAGDFIHNWTAATGNFLAARKTATTSITIYAGNTTNTVVGTDNNNVYEVVCIVWDGASSRIQVNTASTAAATGTTGTGSAARIDGARIGSNSGGTGNFFNGEVARLLLVKGRVSASNIATEMQALGTDYGITVT
jgi:uncharacterized protein YaaQ